MVYVYRKTTIHTYIYIHMYIYIYIYMVHVFLFPSFAEKCRFFIYVHTYNGSCRVLDAGSSHELNKPLTRSGLMTNPTFRSLGLHSCTVEFWFSC